MPVINFTESYNNGTQDFPKEKKNPSKPNFDRVIHLHAKDNLTQFKDAIQQLKDQLAQINNWLDQINQGLTAARHAQELQQNFVNFPQGFETTITHMAVWAKSKDLNIDIKLKRGNNNTIYSILETKPELVTQQMQNISQTIQTQAKLLSTEANKTNSDMSTHVEIYSTMLKRNLDSKLNILNKIS